MAKRFTSTEKWIDPWFCELQPLEKLFWVYLLDNCNHAGIWQVNWPLIRFHLGDFEFEPRNFDGRIKVLTEEKWYISKFVEFQYGELNPENRAHLSVIHILEKEGACKGLTRGLQGRKDMDMDKDKDMDMDNKSVVKVKEQFGDFVLLTQDQYQKLCADFTQPGADDKIKNLNLYIGSKGDKYKSHYHTILNWARKDEPKTNNQNRRVL